MSVKMLFFKTNLLAHMFGKIKNMIPYIHIFIPIKNNTLKLRPQAGIEPRPLA